jgi:hypothetical protein
VPLAFSVIKSAVKFELSRIAAQAFGESMRLFAVYAAAILCVCGLSAALAAERFGQWSLEQPDDFVFALSFKRPSLFDDRTAASQLAFVCNQEKKDVAVLLIPLDGTSTSRHEAIPVAVQKTEKHSDQSDLLQRWENGPGYISLESPDEQEVASYLKDREAEGVKSVHFYFPNDLDASTQTTNHMVVDVAGFSGGVAAFTQRCEQSHSLFALFIGRGFRVVSDTLGWMFSSFPFQC